MGYVNSILSYVKGIIECLYLWVQYEIRCRKPKQNTLSPER